MCSIMIIKFFLEKNINLFNYFALGFEIINSFLIGSAGLPHLYMGPKYRIMIIGSLTKRIQEVNIFLKIFK